MTEQSTSPQIDRRQSALLHRACRHLAPDVWLAARFLPRTLRDRLLAAAGFLRLLSDIVAGREVWDDLEPEHHPEHEGDAHPSGGCACGSDSLETRAAVAHNIVEFLFEEAVPGAIGRPELEAFLALRRSSDLPRGAFDSYVDGCSTSAGVRRLATQRALDRVLDALSVPLSEIVCEIVLGAQVDRVIRDQAVQATRFIVLGGELLAVRRSVVERDRCFIPLELLAAFALRDADFTSWLSSEESATSDALIEQQCTRVIEHYRSLCLAQLAGAVPLLGSLPGGPARAFAAYAGLWADAVLSEPIGRREPPHSLTERLRAHRFRAWRHAIGQRIDPRIISAATDAARQGVVESATMNGGVEDNR